MVRERHLPALARLHVVRAPLNRKDIVVTALKDENSKLKLIAWQIDANGQITRKGSATAGAASLELVSGTAIPGAEWLLDWHDGKKSLQENGLHYFLKT